MQDMNRRFLRSGIAFAAALMLQAALADKNDPPVFTPLSIVQRPDSLDECYLATAGNLAKGDEPSVKLTIAPDGTLKELTLPEGSPEWMKELSGCAIKQFRFSPASRNGNPIEGQASLTITFRARGPDSSAGVAIENVGPLITPPRLLSKAGSLIGCIPTNIKPGQLSRFVVSITVLPDGSARDLILPPGSEFWHEKIADCILRHLTFYPGTLDGVPVEAQATLPLVITNDSGELSSSELRSTAAELEAAYRACYPSDLLTMTSAHYRFNVATNGKVSNPKVVKGTGDRRLDEAGACMMKMLEFTPMKQNGRGIKSIVTWELPIRPPR